MKCGFVEEVDLFVFVEGESAVTVNAVAGGP